MWDKFAAVLTDTQLISFASFSLTYKPLASALSETLINATRYIDDLIVWTRRLQQNNKEGEQASYI